jgi:hypothetical protein
MDMFGGLTKTSSRIAIAAALGLVVGGFAFKATPARAADLGGDCCADLEERVAELEATTVRKGNKKVSVTLSGWVIKSFNWWDDGGKSSAYVGDKGYDLGSRFAITGSATIAPGWSAGYNLTVNVWGTKFATGGTSLGLPVTGASNQFGEGGFGLNNGSSFGSINTLYSFIYIKSDKWGTLNWGHLSPASDNKVVLADISGTVIESNSVFFEGASFILRPKGTKIGGFGGLDNGLTWGNFLLCQGLGAGLGTDCFGAAQPAVRYDSPTWGGFSFQTSWGKQEAINPILGFAGGIPSPESNFWDLAVMYTADWNSIKLSAAYTYTWEQSALLSGSFSPGFCDPRGEDGTSACIGDQNSLHNDNLHQIGASILHKPSGLGIFGQYTHEETGGHSSNFLGFDSLSIFASPVFFNINTPTATTWYLKHFWRKTWSPIGATTLFGEYGQYNDQFSAFGGGLCEAFDGSFGTNIDTFCSSGSNTILGTHPVDVFVTGSEVQRWGLGVVQEIDSAAMHVYARWQHQELDLSLTGINENVHSDGSISFSREHVGQGFDNWDLFQVGGIIFF